MKNRLIVSNLILSQSLTAFLVLFACFYWFPYSLSDVINFTLHVKLLILANLILGPFFIMLIYKEGKKGLKGDLIIICVLQAAAFLFGTYSLYQKHPAYAVFTVDRFTLMSAKEVQSEKIRFTELKQQPLLGTKMVFAKNPKEQSKRNEILLGYLFGGKPDLDGRPEYYEPYLMHISKVLEKSIPVALMSAKDANLVKLNAFLSEHGGNTDSYAYLPLQTSVKDVIWVLDSITAQPVGILDIDPWKLTQSSKQHKTKSKARRWLI